MDDTTFDRIADKTLRSLLASLDEIDGLEAELEQGVLTIAFERGAPFIVNSHRAARQIWMAADRTAWHFDPDASGSSWNSTRAPHDELRSALQAVLAGRLGRPVSLSTAGSS